MNFLKTFILLLLLFVTIRVEAYNEINLTFNRSGASPSTVVINVTDENGAAISGVSAELTSNIDFKTSSNAVTSSILCPNVNATASPTIELTFTLTGVKSDFAFSTASFDIHALNGQSGYQENNDGRTRQWTVELLQGVSSSFSSFGSLENIDIADGVGSAGAVHKFWDITGTPQTTNSPFTLKMIITAGDENVGCFFGLSQIKLSTPQTPPVEVPQPFISSSALGSVEASYSIKSIGGKWLTINSRNSLTLSDNYDLNNNQQWYFVGTDNENGWQIVLDAEPDRIIGLSGTSIVLKENLPTTWRYNASVENPGYFYFTSNDAVAKTLKVTGDSLFCFDKLHPKYAREMQIYDNPCGAVGSVFAKEVSVVGHSVISSLIYTSDSKPATWHVMYSLDKGVVSKENSFDINVELSQNAPANMVAFVYFDWNADGLFETSQQLLLSAKECSGEVYVPAWAVEKESRMRIRLTTNDLISAEDEVNGFVYDFVVCPKSYQSYRNITLSSNSWERGTTSISPTGGVYEYGTEVTITASPFGTSAFLFWKDGNNVVSLDEEYTFDVEESMNLVACFSPNTDKTTWPVGVENSKVDCNLSVLQKGSDIIAICDTDVLAMYLYSVNAIMVAESQNSVIDVSALNDGIYIVQVVTPDGYETTKVMIKN